MIRQIIDLLHANEWYNSGEAIEIAKGKHELADTFKKGATKIKRELKSKR